MGTACRRGNCPALMKMWVTSKAMPAEALLCLGAVPVFVGLLGARADWTVSCKLCCAPPGLFPRSAWLLAHTSPWFDLHLWSWKVQPWWLAVTRFPHVKQGACSLLCPEWEKVRWRKVNYQQMSIKSTLGCKRHPFLSWMSYRTCWAKNNQTQKHQYASIYMKF